MFGSDTYAGATYASEGYYRLIFAPASAQVNVQGNGYDLLMYFDSETAAVNVTSNGPEIVPVYRVLTARVDVTVRGPEIIVSGKAFFDSAAAIINAQGHPFELKLYFDTATAQVLSQGHGFDVLIYFDTETARINAIAYPAGFIADGVANFDPGPAAINVFSYGADILYSPIREIPNLIVTRNTAGNAIEVDVLNPINAKIEIQRADEFLSSDFEIRETRDASNLPWNDGGKSVTGNYQYLATYLIEGEQDGQPVINRSPLSNLRTSFGKNRIL